MTHGFEDHFFLYYYSSGTQCVQALPVKALVLQIWDVRPEIAARPYSGSFSSLGQSPVPPLPHIPSCLTGLLIALPKLWQICGLDGATATTMVAGTVTSSFCSKWNSGTPDSRTLLDGWKMGEEFVRQPGSNPGCLPGKPTPWVLRYGGIGEDHIESQYYQGCKRSLLKKLFSHFVTLIASQLNSQPVQQPSCRRFVPQKNSRVYSKEHADIRTDRVLEILFTFSFYP
jgi:hypothetical protein